MSDTPARLTAALADRYRIEREVGAGGMATVYLAQDLKHDRRVAIKVLRTELAASIGADRFLREIHIAAQLQHPHILPLLDSGDAGGFLYYVMPYVDGESLRSRLTRSGELPIPETIKLITEIVDALSYAHAHGVVHRDIKPDNIMLSGRHALVMDFGVAKAVSEASGRNQITTAGVALGTPAYMAPEQAAADPHLDHRVDIYAVGVLAYELLGGRPPFVGGSPQQVLAAHVTETPEPVSRHRPGLPPALDQTVMKCLAKRAADRWQTADELLAQLEPLTTPSAGMTPTQTRPLTAVGSGRRRVPLWLAWTAGGALVAGGALAVTLTQRTAPAIAFGKRIAVAVGPAIEDWPTLAPDGKTIVFRKNESGVGHLFVQQVDGGAPVPITMQLTGEACCGAISPDGARVLFLGGEGLYIVPTLGGQARLIVPGQSLGTTGPRTALYWGSWSPDGKRIAYTRADSLFVQTVDAATGTAIVAGADLHSPSWSSDGRWIAYVEGNPSFHLSGNLAPSVIKVVPAGGGIPVAVTDAEALNTSPVWLPGRSAILFVSSKDGGRDVYQVSITRSGKPAADPLRVTTGLNPARITLSADGKRLGWSLYSETANVWSVPIPVRDSVPISTATPVTSGDQNIETATISRDGKWLYYDSDISGNSDIWRLPLAEGTAAGRPEQLTSDPAGDFHPSVSPDGKEIVFHSFRTGNRDLFVMPAAGGPTSQVTTSPQHDWNGNWSPDGQSLVFDEQTRGDSDLWLVHRRADGQWEAPRALPHRGSAALAAWSPDGRSISFNSLGGPTVIDTATGRERHIGQAAGAAWTLWSRDSRTIYYADLDPRRGLIIRSVPAEGGRMRTLVYANAPDRQVHRYGFAASADRFYFPLIERKADVWVAELEPK